jgi:hypothetical protein
MYLHRLIDNINLLIQFTVSLLLSLACELGEEIISLVITSQFVLPVNGIHLQSQNYNTCNSAL